MAVAVAVTTAAGGSGPSSSSECPLPNWAMLDRYVFTRLDLTSCKENETTSPLCRTSQDDPFRVSFRFVAPPAISRFYLHVQGGNLSEDCHSSCRILASHRNAVLFCLYVPLPVPVEYLCNPEDESFPRFFKQDLFVYIAGNKPSLKLLPPCPRPLEEGVEDQVAAQQLYDPLADIIQFPDAEALCILCDDEKDYVVGYLCVSREVTIGSGAEEIEAQLCLYYSYDSSWEMHALPIFCEQKDMDALFSWSTKTAMAFGTCLCWIDYECGILFCDMSQENLRVYYLPLPVDHHLAPNVCIENYRSISVVQDEGVSTMKFVDVRPSRGYVSRPCSDGFEINFWTLVVEPGSMGWKHEHGFVLRDNEQCISKLVPTPHGPLMLPIVSMEDPHVAYFVICELEYDSKKAWLVPIDLISRSVMYLLPHHIGEDDHADDADMARRNCQCFGPFLPTVITKFFPQIARDSTAIMEAHDALPNYLRGDIPVNSLETSVKKEEPAHPWVSSYALEPNVGRLHSEASMEFAQNIIPQFVFPQGVTEDIQTKGFQQVSFRLLCSMNLVGGLIGKRGLIIRGIEHETGVFIDIGACVGGCKECVVTIAAMESPDQCSKVQGALLRIFGRMVELERNAHSMFDKPSECYVRALVQERHVGYLTGLLGGAAIKEIMNMSRARIKILEHSDLPACASRCERVLQIAGDLLSVSYALCLVSSKLRNQVFSSMRINHNNGSSNFAETYAARQVNASSAARYSTDSFPGVDHRSSLSYEIGKMENSFSAIQLSPSEVQEPDHGSGVQIIDSNEGMWKAAYWNGI